MKFQPLAITEVVLIEPDVHQDARGFLLESYQKARYAEGGVGADFVQDNHSRSRRGTLRGLHAQVRKPQGKLVRVIQGEVFDVAVDARRGSPSFGQWVGATLSAENFRQLWVPAGFLHGFITREPDTEVVYKCTDYYAPECDGAVRWDSCGINWDTVTDPVLSAKDAAAPALADFVSPFTYEAQT